MTAKSNFDGEQLGKLKVWFDINPDPDRLRVDHISAQMGVGSASVWMWFHNQRNRVKANPDISPSKVKTATIKGSRSSATHVHKVKTDSMSKRLDCNGNAGDLQEQVKDADGNLQDRVKAKKVHIRGILRRPEASQQSGGRSAEEGLTPTVKESERRQHARLKFSGEVRTVNRTELMQERIGGSINRTEKEADPQELIGAEPAQGCSKTKEKVVDSLKHNRATSFPGYIKNKEKVADSQACNTAKPPQQCINIAVTKADSHKQHQGKPTQVSISRTVKEKNTQEPRSVKPTQESTKKVLKDADSQKLVSNKPVQLCIRRTEKAADCLARNILKPAQGCTNSAEKVSKKKHRSLSQSKKECLLKQNKLAHREKNSSVPKKISSNGKIPVNNGVHERVKVPEKKRQIGVNSDNIRLFEERGSKLKRQNKGHVAKRKVAKVPSSSDDHVHHRAAENNQPHLSRSRQVTDMSSSHIHKKKIKHKLRKEKRIKVLLSRKSNPSVNRVRSDNLCKESDVSQGKPQSRSKMPSKPNTSREGIFSALSLPHGKTNVDLSDYSDAEDFQDDQNKRTHTLSIKKTNKAGTLGGGKSIPVLSGKRPHSALADCSNRKAAGTNRRRISLKSLSEVQKNASPVSPVKCEVSSTSTSQSSVISSTVEEVRDPLNQSCKGCPKAPDSQDGDSCEIAIRITKRSLQRDEKESVEEVRKRTVPVISDDKIWDPHHSKFLFKRELSVSLIKINLSSLSDKREVTVSSKMNPISRHKRKKGGGPLCKDDTTNINSNVSVNFSCVQKSTERSIWSSIASPVEKSNKVWSAIASSAKKSHEEIPFIETSTSIDRDLNKFWSSVASSAEMPPKEIPFIESSTSADGESTPSSSQDCIESSEGQNRSNKESILDEGSCEVSSSVDLEKTPTDLTENVEETEKTSSAVVKKNQDEVEETTADVMKRTKDIEKTPEELMETMENLKITSAGMVYDLEEPEKSAADLEESREEVETPAEWLEHMDEAEKTSANLMDTCSFEEIDKTPAESTEAMEEANKVPVEPKGSRGEVARTAADLMESQGEVDKAPTELVELTEISQGNEKDKTDKKHDSEVLDLYENIDSPDYDICTSYIVIDEVGCSDTEEESGRNLIASPDEFSMESTHSASKSASPTSPNVKNTKTGEVIDLDNFSYDDEVILVSSSTAKQTRKEPPGNKALKNQSVCNSKQGSAVASKPSARDPINPTSSKATKEKDSHEVIDLDYCSEDDEVLLLSTLSPCDTILKDDSIKENAELSHKESNEGSPKCLQNKAQEKSDSQVPPIEKENMIAPQDTPSVRDKLSESPGDSGNSEIETSDPVDENSPSSIIDADMESEKSGNSSSVQNDGGVQVGESPKLEEIHEHSADSALPLETEVDNDNEHIYETTEMCLIKNVVSLYGQSVSGEDLVKSAVCAVPPPFVQGQEDGITLEMSCDTVLTMSNIGDHLKSPEKLYTSKQNMGWNDLSSSDELVIDMEACDQMESPLQEKDVLEDTCASTNDAVVVNVDATEQSMGCSDSTSSGELVIDKEACNQMKSTLQEKDVLENTSASQSDAVVVKLDPAEQNGGRCELSSLDELIIDMEACDQMKSPLQEKDVSENTSASQIHAVVVKLDPAEQNGGRHDSTSSDELIIDMEACDQMESLLQERGVLEDTCASTSDEAIENLDTTEQSMGHSDSTSSDELVIDMEASPLQENDVSDNTSVFTNDPVVKKLDSSEDNTGHEDSLALDEVDLNVTCERDTTRPDAGEDLQPTEELVQSRQHSGYNDSASSDELVIDENTCDEMKCQVQEKEDTEVNCASEQNLGCYDSASSDELVIDENAYDETQCQLQDKDASEDNCASPSDAIVARIDPSQQNSGPENTVSKELDIDVTTCEQVKGALPEISASGIDTSSPSDAFDRRLDPAEQNVAHEDSTSDELYIDVTTCDQSEYSLAADAVTEKNASASPSNPVEEKIDPAEQNVAYEDSTSDELYIDVTTCDQSESSLAADAVTEKNSSASPGNPVEEKIDPAEQNVAYEDSTSDELYIDVTTCDQSECSLAADAVTKKNFSAFPSNPVEEKIDPAEQNVAYEDSTSDELYIDVTTCDQSNSSLAADAFTEKDASASPSNRLEEKIEPAEQNVAYEDSTSSDELYIDVTTHYEMECPKDDALSENSAINVTLESSVAGALEEGMTSGSDSPLDKESPGIDSEDVSEIEPPVPATDSTPSCEVVLPHETEAHVDRKGSTSVVAGTTCMELSKNLDAEDVTGEARGSAEAFTSDLNTTAAPVQTQPNADVAVKGTLKNSSPSAAGAPSVEPQGISSESFHPTLSQKEKPYVDGHCASSPYKEINDAANIPVGSIHVPSSESKDVSSALSAITSPVIAEDPQPQSNLSSDAASPHLPKTNDKMKSEPSAKKDSQSGTNTPSGDPSPSKLDNSTEKQKCPRSLDKLVSDLTQRLGILIKAATCTPATTTSSVDLPYSSGISSNAVTPATTTSSVELPYNSGILSKAATPATTTSSVGLPYSSVSINPNAHYSAKSSSSSSTEPAPQPPKPTPQPRRGSKRRVITNKTFKRPPLPEEVQVRIQQLNPYPCDHTWMRNAAVVELAQKEVQLHCQPGESSSTKDHSLGANMESSYEPMLGSKGTNTGGLNFCYQPGIGLTNGDSRGATDRDSHSTASRSINSSDNRVEARPFSNSRNSGQSTSVNTMNSGHPTIKTSSSLRHPTAVNSTNSGHSTTVKNNSLLGHLLESTEPMTRKRSRTQSGDSKTRKKTRRRRKSSADIGREIASRANAFANGNFSEKDIREEWMELLKVMEESTFSGSEEESPSSETVVPASSTTASALEGHPSSATAVPASSTTAFASEGDPSSPTAVPAEGQSPVAPDTQEASPGVSKTSSSTAFVSEVDDLSDMPSILRVFSLRDQEGGEQESSPNLAQPGLGSFNLDSARIVEEPGTPAHIYSSTASTARRFQDTTNLVSSLPSYQLASHQLALLSMNRKRHSSHTYGSQDGVPASKAPATVVNGSTFQGIRSLLQQRQANTNSSFPQQVSSSRLNHSGNSSGALQNIAPRNTYVINTPMMSPSSLNAQGATGVLASPPVLASQPVVNLVTLQPGAQQQVQPYLQPSLLGNGNLPSLLNPLILNQQIQRRRLSASPTICTPYPTSSISANIISGNPQVNFNTLSDPIANVVGSGIGYLAGISQGMQLPSPVHTQWTQPTTNLQLAPVTSQLPTPVNTQWTQPTTNLQLAPVTSQLPTPVNTQWTQPTTNLQLAPVTSQLPTLVNTQWTQPTTNLQLAPVTSQLPTPVNTQWTQPTTNLELAPVTSQTYNNGLDSQLATLFYTQQGPTITYLSGGPQ